MFQSLAQMVWDVVGAIILRTGYLRSQNAFPQPLTRDEEARHLDVLARGGQDSSRRAFEVLVERNLRLVAHVVKKFNDTGEDSDDLISIGTIGLIKGIKTFDSRRGTRLATYAARCIENEMLMTAAPF